MELDLQSLFELHVKRCAQLYSLAEKTRNPPPPAFGLDIRGRYRSAKDRRHLLVIPKSEKDFILRTDGIRLTRKIDGSVQKRARSAYG
jgi:hypothetical protein